VKVVLVPGGHVMTVAFAIGLSIQELKRYLASELRVHTEVLQLCLNSESLFLQVIQNYKRNHSHCVNQLLLPCIICQTLHNYLFYNYQGLMSFIEASENI